MAAYKRDEEEETACSPVVTRSGVVPAMRDHAIPTLWDEADEDHEVTGQTGQIPPSMRKKGTPHLTIMTGIGAGKVVSFEGRTHMVIGRSRSADLHVTEDGISRRHCAVVRRGNAVFVEDLKSTNGTIVNGTRTTMIELHPGDRIQVGEKLILQFGMFDETEETLARRLFEGLTCDALTGVANRRSFDEHLASELAHARRHGSPLSVLIVGLDDIRSVNEGFGRTAGDEVLKAVAKMASQTVRASDVFCRYSGTQFAFVVRDTVESASRFAERVRARIAAQRVSVLGKTVTVTASIGVAGVGERGAQLSGEGLTRLAAKRLERAKSSGRDRICAE